MIYIALQQNFTWNSIELNNVYIKIRNLNLTSNKDIELSVEWYPNKLISDECAITNIGYLQNKNYTFTPDLESIDNFIKQGYNYLKTLDEFQDAIDI